jgi:type II secretory pathway pseudopilin PulG
MKSSATTNDAALRAEFPMIGSLRVGDFQSLEISEHDFAMRHKRSAGFTLVEVLAALTFMAVVIPVAIAAMHVAGLSGVVAQRKAVAARIADRVLNENVVTSGSGALAQNGTVIENGQTFRWVLNEEEWPVSMVSTSALQVLNADVTFSVQGQDYSVRLSTLVNGS